MNIKSVALYVKDSGQALAFWTEKVKLIQKSEVTYGSDTVFTVGKKGYSADLELVPISMMEKNEYNLNLGTPSILFSTENLESTRKDLMKNNVEVSEIEKYNNLKVFTFFDHEGNPFAVTEDK